MRSSGFRAQCLGFGFGDSGLGFTEGILFVYSKSKYEGYY